MSSLSAGSPAEGGAGGGEEGEKVLSKQQAPGMMSRQVPGFHTVGQVSCSKPPNDLLFFADVLGDAINSSSLCTGGQVESLPPPH